MDEPFNPLGRFDPDADITSGVLDKCEALYNALPDVDDGGLTRVYFHWSAGAMSNCDAAYNVEALIANNTWALQITHDPQDNVVGLNDRPMAAHTYKRNAGAVGIAITGMDGAARKCRIPHLKTGIPHFARRFMQATDAYAVETGVKPQETASTRGVRILEQVFHDVDSHRDARLA